jgi:hypothetical protein
VEKIYKLSDADLVWNRACEGDVDSRFAGDRCLADLLLFHGLAMNGGFTHAIECVNATEVAAAASVYRFFGFDDVADMIVEVRSVFDETDGFDSMELGAAESLEFATWDRYTSAIPDDDALSARFKRHFLRRRSDFAPL